VIIDSSAIAAIAYGEKEQFRLIRTLASAPTVSVPAPIWLETSIVLSKRLGPRLDTFLDGIVAQFRVDTVAFDFRHSRAAFDAWNRFGRGNSPACLSFADCISYATARLAGEPLLFVGEYFAKTDIEAA